MTWHSDMPDEFRNEIVTGDARELAERIPDCSVDLIFTDPIYDRIDDYRWLAETAARVLKPGGACLVWSNGKWHYQNAKWLEGFGLCYRDQFAYVIIKMGRANFDGHILRKCSRVNWFDKDETSKLIGYPIDGYGEPSYGGGKSSFKWTKSLNYSINLLNAFVEIGMVVFDPFTGGGTVPAVCKMLSRNYVAFEIEPDVAENARERVLNTQPPLFVLEPEQITMELDH